MKSQENIALEFDRFSDNYTQDMIRFVPHYQKQLSSVIEYLPEGFSPNKILDIGCGNGNVIALLASQYPNAHFTMVDASSEMINLCMSRFPRLNGAFIKTYFQDLELPFENFDLITAVLSLHHLHAKEKIAFFKNAYKWLRKGGILCSSDLMIDKTHADHPALLTEWKDFMMSNQSTQEEWEWMMDHYDKFDRPSDFNKQIQWLEEAGFAKTHIPWRVNYWVSFQGIK